jgi:hypothetical protein
VEPRHFLRRPSPLGQRNGEDSQVSSAVELSSYGAARSPPPIPYSNPSARRSPAPGSGLYCRAVELAPSDWCVAPSDGGALFLGCQPPRGRPPRGGAAVAISLKLAYVRSGWHLSSSARNSYVPPPGGSSRDSFRGRRHPFPPRHPFPRMNPFVSADA